jgi:hypothetical protein
MAFVLPSLPAPLHDAPLQEGVAQEISASQEPGEFVSIRSSHRLFGSAATASHGVSFKLAVAACQSLADALLENAHSSLALMPRVNPRQAAVRLQELFDGPDTRPCAAAKPVENEWVGCCAADLEIRGWLAQWSSAAWSPTSPQNCAACWVTQTPCMARGHACDVFSGQADVAIAAVGQAAEAAAAPPATCQPLSTY